MSRLVTLVLVDSSGAVLGALPPYEVPMPWWQEVVDVVDGARQRYGVDVTVLRLLTAARERPHGGEVTYLAQLRGPGTPSMVDVPALAAPVPDARRAPWAEPGGADATLAWAAGRLEARGRLVVRSVQQRAWNLSAIWRLDTVSAGVSTPVEAPEPVDLGREAAWVKQVPAFFAHEAEVLRWLGREVPGTAPELLAAAAPGRLLLAAAPGVGRYQADAAERDALARDMHRVQLRADPSVLLAAGVPDLRGSRLAERLRAVVTAYAPDDPVLAALADGLDARLAAVAECALPDTLVHGDLHPGNAIGERDARMIIDWGDSFVGHPAFDILRLTEDVPEAPALIEAWAARWRADVPGCDPEHAVALLAPVAALRNAAAYAGFLERIEPSEHPFHAADVPFWLDAARRASALS